MDPNQFPVDSGRIAEVLGAIVLLSFFVERALAVLFESQWFVQRFSGRGIKEPITLLVAFGVCKHWGFDALSLIWTRQKPGFWGYTLTAAIVAGGSKASIKFFHDVLGAMSTAEAEQKKRKSEPRAVVIRTETTSSVQAPSPPPPANGGHESTTAKPTSPGGTG